MIRDIDKLSNRSAYPCFSLSAQPREQLAPLFDVNCDATELGACKDSNTIVALPFAGSNIFVNRSFHDGIYNTQIYLERKVNTACREENP